MAHYTLYIHTFQFILKLINLFFYNLKNKLTIKDYESIIYIKKIIGGIL
jgi:hypothetical protein